MGLPGYIQTTTFMKKCGGPAQFYTLVIGGSLFLGSLLTIGISKVCSSYKKAKEKKIAINHFQEEWENGYKVLCAKGNKNSSFAIAFNDDEIKLLEKTKKGNKTLVETKCYKKVN